MRMLETTLLTGPYDWDEALNPRADFEARLGAVRAVLRERGLDGLIVGGISPEHGALGYLTGFVPKLGPALAFVPRDGKLRVVFSGGGAMLSSAQRLTYVSDIRAMRDPEQEAAAWLSETKGTRFALWGDYAITTDVRQALDRVAPVPLVVLDDVLDALRRHKSERERALIARACAMLGVTFREMRAAGKNGGGVRTAAIAAERTAYAAGAQDVRMLVSLRPGGMPQPLIGPHDPQADPVLACIAIRFAGYWAEGLATLSTKRTATLTTSEGALSAVLREVRPGVTADVLNAAASRALAGLQPHPFIAENLGNGIGLSREEAPFLSARGGVGHSSAFQEDDICSLRMGASGDAVDSAIVSAMVRVGPNGADVLWRE